MTFVGAAGAKSYSAAAYVGSAFADECFNSALRTRDLEMSSLLNQLQSDEAILLMYIADELPAADRAKIETRLDSDANLRARLAELRSLRDTVNTSLAHLDRVSPLPSDQAAAR